MAPKTVSKLTGAVAPKSHSIEKATEAITTEAHPAMPVAPITPPEERGRAFRKMRKTA